ncbi:MAG: helix-turn-helix domain-containing protein [Candidatus Saccharimonadaceae bacterium]
MEISKRHVQLPNSMTKREELSPKDLFVYVTLKRHLNKETKECFPSLECLSRESGYSIPPIRKSIEVLKLNGYIKVRKEGRKNIYSFNSYKNFEPFSYEFLDCEDLSTNEKAYLISSQQYMYKDARGLGKISYSNEQLGDLLNVSSKTISRLDKSLEDKGFLTIVKTGAKNPETGLMINEKFFKLDELGQAVIWALQKHEEDIENLKVVTESNSKDLKITVNEVASLRNEVKRLTDIINGTINSDEFTL